MRSKLYQISFLIFTFIVLISSVFAWFSLGETVKNDFLTIKIGKIERDTYLFLSKNEEAFQLISNSQQLKGLLSNGIPGDSYQFKLNIISYLEEDTPFSLSFKSVSCGSLGNSEGCSLEANILDVYLLSDISLNDEEIVLTANESGTSIGYEGQVLKENRLRNYLTSSGDIILFKNEILKAELRTTILFTISVDKDLVNTSYYGNFYFEEMIIGPPIIV